MIYTWGKLDILGPWYLTGRERSHYHEIRNQIKAISEGWA